MPYYVTWTCDYCDGEYAHSRIQDHTDLNSAADALAEAVRQKELMTTGEMEDQWEVREDGTLRCYDCQRRGNTKLEP